MDKERASGWSYLDSRSAGMPLVLLHAFPLQKAMWEEQVRLLEKAARVIAPDLPGFGGTPMTGVPGLELSSLDAYADAVVHFLENLGVRRAVFGGLSMGGYIVLATWRRHRERVAGLILADTRATADSPAARENRFRLVERLKAEGPAAAVEQFVPRLIGPTSRTRRPDLITQLRDWIMQNPVEGMIAASLAMAARPDSTELLPTINVPTVVIVGEEDEFSPPAEAEAMAARIPGATLARIPEAGHLTALEQPEAFAEAVRPVLAALP
ncbi:MAG TPA: alpha/beta fold hydrolase [Firmicutes bacterium]|nr:alpha/beta fold hydrolase [Bacillota bacterium]